MDHNNSKLKGLSLPAYIGKTSIDIIKRRFETISQLQEKTDVNIWIAKPESSDDDSDDEKDSDAKVFSWISGSKKNVDTLVDTLTLDILKGKVEMIVSNAIRIGFLVRLLESLDELGALFHKTVNIWIDEADQSVCLWSNYLHVLNNMPMIQHVYAIIHPISDKAEAYQAMARVFGNIGQNIADAEYEWTTFGGEFTDREEANELLHKNGCNRNLAPTTPASIEKYMVNGFEKSTTKTTSLSILSYDKVVSELSKTTTKTGRMFICYKDLSDPSSVVYIVRGVIKKL
jgi:hypothetical protein